ncbi:MAG TPA: peptide MFS transporter [Williamwhitmania sp.]|nr:peptide MFS transporter [Williamwhitmania sp.]
MFKGHPKGLFVAFFANMGERFGFYTMMAILVLFLQAKFGLTGTNAGIIYSIFYASIYALALVGGIVADRLVGLKKTITFGIVTMALGYVLIAIPTASTTAGLIQACAGLFVIAFGNGMFKGNLQAVVGNLYEDPKFQAKRDSAFSIFYMGINIGALFAPTVAISIKEHVLGLSHFVDRAELPSLCWNVKNGVDGSAQLLTNVAHEAFVGGTLPINFNVNAFAEEYIRAFSTGYNYAFGFAAFMMLVSLAVYFAFGKMLATGFSVTPAKDSNGEEIKVKEMSREEVKSRLTALFLVFAVVIFFWMSFHQNGLTLTYFARDYTQRIVGPETFFWFDLWALLPMLGTLVGIYFLLKRESTSLQRIIGAISTFGLGYLSFHVLKGMPAANLFSPELFQHLNPFFIVALTPVAVASFSWMNKRGIEPSSPRKIGIGMILAATGFIVMAIGSLGLISQSSLHGNPVPDNQLVSPYLLISTYFVLTIAELFLSPMGISFVSKVAPPKYKGTMQGGWLAATALGNQLLFIGAIFYGKFELWQLWSFFVICCLVSAAFIFFMMKRLEASTK